MKEFLSIWCFFSFGFLLAQDYKPKPVRWVDFEETEQMAKLQPKPILVSVHTDWCGWCKKMEITTFVDPQIATFLNDYFYPISFDAETKDTINFRGKQYVNQDPSNRRGTNTLTAEIMGDSRSYPTTILMDHNFEHAVVIPGFLTAKDLASFLVFYKEGLYMSENINNFRVDFDNTFSDKKPIINSQVAYKSLQDVLDIPISENTKKTFIHFYEKDCISCQVMDSISYSNPFVARYLNKNFNSVRFNITSPDTLVYNGAPILPSEDYLYNNFAVSVLKGQMKLPAVAFMTEDHKIIFPIQEYLNQNAFEAVIHFIEEEAYKEQQFQDFYKNFTSQIVESKRIVDEVNQAFEANESYQEALIDLLYLMTTNKSVFSR